MARGFNYAPGASVEVQEAMTPGLDRARILELGGSRNAIVRATVASRLDCPLGLMVTLAHDFSADVRACVARNASAQRTVMAYLSADRSVDVVRALLENPNLAQEILEELAFHKKGEIRDAAIARLDAVKAGTSSVAEDHHTPELAEHVAPIPQRMATDGPAPTSFSPVTAAQPEPAFPVAAPTPVETHIPQIFSPHSTADVPAPTRTAPVRGFKPKP
jgi:hypothetical protein